ncbi:hypothetical protein VFPFJ_05037 [Purpureocillium lilacinum]|uniref:Uncharacterized protein n=1 Tax=Purpureocillium lilacinum TaxID=33203 RepID=A0A179H1F4_PURLI|nr:hypothetical protein VFPFJ_05037 [Purpureocillium lilacinum]OAQ84086.1 hypothetical protein VFPBJ_02854 [Purpureocillium lilacinum]OAQ90878.1 hypothetical protein VFPFJ_05037 [Purpureocillium lilacinum]
MVGQAGAAAEGKRHSCWLLVPVAALARVGRQRRKEGRRNDWLGTWPVTWLGCMLDAGMLDVGCWTAKKVATPRPLFPSSPLSSRLAIRLPARLYRRGVVKCKEGRATATLCGAVSGAY